MSAVPPNDDLVAILRRHIVAVIVATPIVWEPTGDGVLPYQATVEGRSCLIRVNEFPAEPLYSLVVDGEALADLEDWPAAWVKPLAPRR